MNLTKPTPEQGKLSRIRTEALLKGPAVKKASLS